jgi:hypothetical protein
MTETVGESNVNFQSRDIVKELISEDVSLSKGCML